MHQRVEESLSAEGLEPRRLDAQRRPSRSPTATSTHSSIIVLVCNVDAPREMATLRRLRREWREPPIVVISPPATGTGVRRALEAGADAFVFESKLELTLAATVRAVASGQSVVPRKVRGSLERPALSHRERQVLALVAGGPHQRPDRQAARSFPRARSRATSPRSSRSWACAPAGRPRRSSSTSSRHRRHGLTGIERAAPDFDGNGQGAYELPDRVWQRCHRRRRTSARGCRSFASTRPIPSCSRS